MFKYTKKFSSFSNNFLERNFHGTNIVMKRNTIRPTKSKTTEIDRTTEIENIPEIEESKKEIFSSTFMKPNLVIIKEKDVKNKKERKTKNEKLVIESVSNEIDNKDKENTKNEKINISAKKTKLPKLENKFVQKLSVKDSELTYTQIQDRIVKKPIDPKIKSELDEFDAEYKEMLKNKKDDSQFVNKIWKETAQQVDLGISPLKLQQQIKLDHYQQIQENVSIKQSKIVLEEIIEILKEQKAIDIVVINVSKKIDWAKYMIVVTGQSKRHLNAIRI